MLKKKIFILVFILFLILFIGGNVKAADSSDTNTGTDTIEWTDFSNAEYKVDWDGVCRIVAELSKVTTKEGRAYYAIITKDESKPELNTKNATLISKDSNNNLVVDITKYAELNQDLYLWVIEHDNTSAKENFVVSAKKIERPELRKYTSIFKSTFIASSGFQLCFNIPWKADSTNQRRFEVKIGKITDNNILKSIKNNESTAFDKLISYAKLSNSIYDTELMTNSNVLPDCNNDSQTKIDLSVEDGEYYYLYVDFNDENGKYYPLNPGITIAQAINTGSSWHLFFLGDDNFNWKDFGNDEEIQPKTDPEEGKKEDPTVAPKTMPHTGKDIILTIAIIAVIVSVAYFGRWIDQYRKI